MKRRIRVFSRILSYLATLCAAALFIRRRGIAEFTVLLSALLVHELFHLLSAYVLRVSVRAPAPALLGFRIDYEHNDLPLPSALLLFGSGALGNILLAISMLICSTNFFVPNASFYVCYNLTMALLNLLPVYPLDGGRIAQRLLQKKYGVINAVEIIGSVSCYIAAVLFILGMYVYIFYSDNFLLPLFAVLILSASRREVEYASLTYLLQSAGGGYLKSTRTTSR